MNSGQCSHYYQQLHNRFCTHLKGVRKAQSIDEVHDIRVSIKKLRVMWMLLGYIKKEKFSKEGLFQIVHKLFKSAGVVRETQINHSLVFKHSYQYLHSFVTELQESLKDKKNALYKQIIKFDLQKFEKDSKKVKLLLSDITVQELIDGCNQFITKEAEIIRELIKSLPDTRRLHKIRIHSRVIREILSLVHEISQSTSVKSELKKIKSINEKLGDWHDIEILIESMIEHDLSSMKSQQKRQFRGFISRHETRQKQREKEIAENLKKYFKPSKFP